MNNIDQINQLLLAFKNRTFCGSCKHDHYLVVNRPIKYSYIGNCQKYYTYDASGCQCTLDLFEEITNLEFIELINSLKTNV